MKINYEDITPKDLEEEEIEVEIAKDAFKGPLACSICNKKMQKAIIKQETITTPFHLTRETRNFYTQ